MTGMPSLRAALVTMSALAVVSDSVLIAFYPHFFERRYGVTSAFHVGAYIAAISIAVMCTLPLWARVARRVETLHLLSATQCAAGVLCLLSWWADTVLAYWVLTVLMFMCKSSYLLMYPYLMRMQPAEAHGHTIGLLSVVVHLASILGAVVGGWALQSIGPAACLSLMAAGDFAQMCICLWLIRTGRVVRTSTSDVAASSVASEPRLAGAVVRLMQLCALTLLFDFSAHLASPFFSVYWERVSPANGTLSSGMAYAIPGVVALAALFVNKRLGTLPDYVLTNLLLGAAGLLLQALPHEPAILVGRVLYGWSLFQLVVKLEVLLFGASTPRSYARDFSVFNFFQNLGVLLSSFAAGALVQRHGIQTTFAIGAAGFAVTALLYRATLGRDKPRPSLAEPVPSLGEAHAR